MNKIDNIKVFIFTIITCLFLSVGTIVHYYNSIEERYKIVSFDKFQIMAQSTELHIAHNLTYTFKDDLLKRFETSQFSSDLVSNDIQYKSGVKSVDIHKMKLQDVKDFDYFSDVIGDYFFLNDTDGKYTFFKKLEQLSSNNKAMFFWSMIDASMAIHKERRILLFTLGVIIVIIVALGGFVFTRNKKLEVQKQEMLSKLRYDLQIKNDTLNKTNQELQHEIYHDALTNLPNRKSMLEYLQGVDEKTHSLMLINIDSFKEINDLYGYQVGDEILVSFANYLANCAEKIQAKAYRLHSDEYAILLENTSEEDLKFWAKKIIDETKTIVIMIEDNRSIEIQITIGISHQNDKLLSAANMSLKHAKKENVDYLFYSQNLNIENKYEQNLSMSKKLKAAIKHKKILAYIQPILDAENLQVNKFEVLARLEDENGNIITPINFIDIAKKNKFYPNITKSIIEQSFEAFKDTEYLFSINISILDILNPDITNFILKHIQEYPKPENITFEILESEGVQNYSDIIKFINIIKKFKCKVALDDFGSGYSNFINILNLKVDFLKIDGSLIKNIDHDTNSINILTTIISFANKLKIKTIAEFVHNKAVFDKLNELKVSYLQGYFISKPFDIRKLNEYKVDIEKLNAND